MTLFSYVARIVKPECCTCSQGQGSATKSLGQCCTIFMESNYLQHVADIGDTWVHVQLPSTLSQNSSEDVKLPVPVKNCRCDHGFTLYNSPKYDDTGLKLHEYEGFLWSSR